MSRPSTSQQRNLTLTEELEKLEQSITLTLQEIDHNFSRAHRIVTTSILPIVEQYAEQSKNVWEGSKFWKHFFESSANVSLSGYEEQPEQTDETLTNDQTHTTLSEADPSSYETPSSEHFDLQPQSHLRADDDDDDIDLSALSLSPSHSTPRAAATTVKQPNTSYQPTSFADYPSPYETLRQEMAASSSPLNSAPTPTNLYPSTPGKSPFLARKSNAIATTPSSSPVLPPTTKLATQPHSALRRDPLLHRVLDRNYRIQATPHTATRRDHNGKAGFPTKSNYGHALDSSPLSSPEIAPPQLHSEIFSSPMRNTPGKRQRKAPKPGISVLTPGKLKKSTGTGAGFPSTRKTAGTEREKQAPKATDSIWPSTDDESSIAMAGRAPAPAQKQYDEWADSDDDNDEGLPFGASPPKTMTFHVPQRRLLRTPAKEASKRIVSDLLQSAGHHARNSAEEELTDDLDIDLDVDYDEIGEPTSPSVVKGRGPIGLEDESF